MGQNNSSEQGLEKAFKVYLLLKVPGCGGSRPKAASGEIIPRLEQS
jgi:hypothetical protein